MAPYKLEDNIREKLEERELKPSADAWQKLEVKLDKTQPKQKSIGWYYIAASFVGVLIVASFFINNTKPQVNNDLVDTTVKEDVFKNASENASERILNNTTVAEIDSSLPDSNMVETASDKEKTNSAKDAEEKQKLNSVKPVSIPKKKSEVAKKIARTEVVASASTSEIEKKKQLEEEKSMPSEEDILFNNKIDEVVASVKQLQEDNTHVTAAEVEKLLDKARRDIQTQRILNSQKVDATALLQDVEWELEKSFRDKVFDALGDGFTKIRTAVIERND